MKEIILAVFSASIVGVTPAALIERMSFQARDHALLPRVGSGVVCGHALLKSRSERVNLGAGDFVMLHLVTVDSLEFRERAAAMELMSSPDPRTFNNEHKVAADAENCCTSADLSLDEHSLFASITSESILGRQERLKERGGSSVKQVLVYEWRVPKVLVTR